MWWLKTAGIRPFYWLSVRNRIGQSMTLLIPSTYNFLVGLVSFYLLAGCGTKHSKGTPKKLECNEYYIPDDIAWERISEDFEVSAGPLLVRDTGGRWGIMYPGSISLSGNTISIAQEAGHANSCYFIGALTPGSTVSFQSNKDSITMKMDSSIVFNGEMYEKSPYPVTNGCWCDWK